jgi:ketosteroid isomerase-like protein
VEREVEHWLRSYGTAWEQADAELVATLFSDDATYRSHIFKEPHRGRDGVRAYWDRATSTQENVTVSWGSPLVAGARVVVEWWTTMRDLEDAVDLTLPGVLLLTFDHDRRCRSLREYWMVGEGRAEPPVGWGRLDPRTSAIHNPVAAWSTGYERAWRHLDAEAVPNLYASDVVYRSHPLRDPHLGRDGVLAYTRQANAAEASPEPRFGTPTAAGRSAAIEYWATLVEDGVPSTLAGCDILLFEDDGLVTEQREYWHLQEGVLDPPSGWGRISPG